MRDSAGVDLPFYALLLWGNRSPACGFSIALLLSVLCSVAAGLVTYMKNLKPAIAYTIEDFRYDPLRHRYQIYNR